MDITTLNIKRLMNTIVPASDLEDLYAQGYQHTKVFIDNKVLLKNHYYDSSGDNLSDCQKDSPVDSGISSSASDVRE